MFLIMPHINGSTEHCLNPNVTLIYVCSALALKCTAWHLSVVAPLWDLRSLGSSPSPRTTLGANAGKEEKEMGNKIESEAVHWSQQYWGSG